MLYVQINLPETVSSPRVGELRSNDAGERGPEHGARQRPLWDSARPEVYIAGVLEDGLVALDGFIGHGAEQFLEGVSSGQAAELAEFHVAGQAKLAAALHVEGHQVHTESNRTKNRSIFILGYLLSSTYLHINF